MAITRILVVDDDSDTREMLVEFLHRHGFAATGAACEEDLHSALAKGRTDLILLDVMLGDQNGVEICARLRQDLDIPLIFISALSADQHRMAGYEVGADDYVAKPFNPELLLARMRAVLRRGRRSSSLVHRRRSGLWRFSGWQYDAKRDEVTSPQGYLVPLSGREMRLLTVLLANPHVPLTREEISEAMDVNETGDHEPSNLQSRAIDVLVGRLRSKIEPDPKHPQLLRTERSVGYVFATDVQQLDN